MLTAFDPPFAARRERHWAGKHFGSVHIAQKDQKSIRINPTRKPRLRESLEVRHFDRLHDQSSWSAPAFTPAFRHIPSLRCQEIRLAFARAEKGALSARMHLVELVEPIGIEPMTSSLQS
jgi:hypothetical protein